VARRLRRDRRPRSCPGSGIARRVYCLQRRHASGRPAAPTCWPSAFAGHLRVSARASRDSAPTGAAGRCAIAVHPGTPAGKYSFRLYTGRSSTPMPTSRGPTVLQSSDTKPRRNSPSGRSRRAVVCDCGPLLWHSGPRDSGSRRSSTPPPRPIEPESTSPTRRLARRTATPGSSATTPTPSRSDPDHDTPRPALQLMLVVRARRGREDDDRRPIRLCEQRRPISCAHRPGKTKLTVKSTTAPRGTTSPGRGTSGIRIPERKYFATPLPHIRTSTRRLLRKADGYRRDDTSRKDVKIAS